MAAPGVAPLHHSDISEAATFQHPPALQQVPREGSRLGAVLPQRTSPKLGISPGSFQSKPTHSQRQEQPRGSGGFAARATGFVQPDADPADVFLREILVHFSSSLNNYNHPPFNLSLPFCPLLPCRQISAKPEAASFSGILPLEAPVATLKSQLKATQQVIKNKRTKLGKCGLR